MKRQMYLIYWSILFANFTKTQVLSIKNKKCKKNEEECDVNMVLGSIYFNLDPQICIYC